MRWRAVTEDFYYFRFISIMKNIESHPEPTHVTIKNYDAIVVGAGFSGLYQLLSLRDKLGMSVRVLEMGGGLAELGIGTGIQVHAAIQRVIPTNTIFQKSCSKSGSGLNVIPNKVKY